MKTFIATRGFTGYPDGKKPVHFAAGQQSQPVPDEFADLMFKKGLAIAPKRTSNDVGPPPPAVANKIAAATRSRRPGRAARPRQFPKD